MKQWQLSGFGLESLRLAEAHRPKPGPHELLVQVSAVSLNYRDKLVIDGAFFPDMIFPFVPTSDAAGQVAEVGEGVTRFTTGDRVTTHFFSKWLDGSVRLPEDSKSLGGPLPGVLSEYLVLHENALVATPDYLTDAEASTLPIAALTAWWALFYNKPLRPGETVLIQGTGGVSIFALQFAKTFGARTVVTSSSDLKLERAKELGADLTINYKTNPEWDLEAIALTEGKGADHLLEVVGGDNLRRSLQALARGGQLALIGFLENRETGFDILQFMLNFSSVCAVGVGHRRAFEEMNAALTAKEIHPVIDASYAFEEAPAALEHLNRGPFGKVVIEVA